MTKLAPEWVRTSDPVIRSPARYRWTTAPSRLHDRRNVQVGGGGGRGGEEGGGGVQFLAPSMYFHSGFLRNVQVGGGGGGGRGGEEEGGGGGGAWWWGVIGCKSYAFIVASGEMCRGGGREIQTFDLGWH